MDVLLKLLPSAATIVAVIVVLFVVNRLLEKRQEAVTGRRFRTQMIMLGVSAGGFLIVILVIPVGDTTRGQLLALIGIVLSAAIALSSTTFLGNAMAGVMLRSVRNFRTGDFIRANGHFGRVSEQGLFHTEIQTEDRELTTLPNLYLVTNPVTTIRSSGTIISATVSLGYDVSRTKIEESLLEAARRTGLKDPFVHILELGDFSVTYRIAGLLTEVKQLLSTRSRLRASAMDALHEGGVEIVSPTFMNTRALPEERIFIQEPSRAAPSEAPASMPEDVVFDKAEEAESLETLRGICKQLAEEIESQEEQVEKAEKGPDREKLEAVLAASRARMERLSKIVAVREVKATDTE